MPFRSNLRILCAESDLDDLRRSVNFEEKRFDEAAADEEEFMEPLPSPEIKDNE
ncbi:MAG: hypothetical protein R3D66_02505 [Alphaproteobacteria bacterium]